MVPICNSTGHPTGECLMPLFIKRTLFTVPVFGFLSPAVILLTVVTNSLICVVLLRRNMRSATNALLVAMALSDMMTGIWPLPCFVFFYSLGGYRDWVPYDWCAVYMALTDHLPTVFHTASIWLTVALAVHRYICVCRPQAAKTWCTVAKVLWTIVSIYIASCLTHITRFVETSYRPVLLTSLSDPSTTTVGCVGVHAPFVAYDINVYYNVYYWFRVVFIHLVPCSVLIVFNALLVQTLRQAQRRRRQLLAQNRKSESRRLAESSVTTMMLVAVVGVFLLVEFPLALLMIVMIVDNTFELTLLDAHSRAVATLLVNLFILLSYPLNFFIYCGMSRQFRDTFKGLFMRDGGGAELDRDGRTMAVATCRDKVVVATKCVTGLKGPPNDEDNDVVGAPAGGRRDDGGETLKNRQVTTADV
jgi:hypothetical protein